MARVNSEELALRILHALLPPESILDEDVSTVAGIISDALTPKPRAPRTPRPIDPAAFDRRVRELCRLSFTGKPVDPREIVRWRQYDTERFDRIADAVREEERKRLNPFNPL
jgi:hypothetical protein